MDLQEIYQKALELEFLSIEEGVYLFENAPTPDLITIGNTLRYIHKPDPIVTWIIDRNLNTTFALQIASFVIFTESLDM